MWIKPGMTAVLAALLCAAPAHAADLASHRALYSFRLASSDPSSGPDAARGQMYYAQDDACDAWTVDRRFAMSYSYPEAADNDAESSKYTAYEGKDGKRFDFSAVHQQAGEEADEWRGTVVQQKDGAAKARYSIPENLSFDLPRGYYLSTAFTAALIEKARAGEHSFSGVVFDGTDINGPVLMSAFIGKRVPPAEFAKGAHIDASLLAPEAWHVRLALLPVDEDDDITPFYEIDMVLHANGVVSHAFDVYKGFTIEESLTALEKLPPRPCR